MDTQQQLQPDSSTERCSSFQVVSTIIELTPMELVQKRLTLMQKLLYRQEDYVAKLKIILLRIKLTFQNDLNVDDETLRYLFGSYEKIKRFHELFIGKLKNVVELKFGRQEQFIRIFQHHITYFAALYGDNVEDCAKILVRIKQICRENSQKTNQLFSDFEHPLEQYIFLPTTYLSSYATFFSDYAKYLPDTNNSFFKVIDLYKEILKNELHIDERNFYKEQQTNQELINRISRAISKLDNQEEIQSKINQSLIQMDRKISEINQQQTGLNPKQSIQQVDEGYNVGILLSCAVVFKKQKSRIYLISQKKYNYLVVIYKEKIQIILKINKTFHLIEFPNLIYFTNRVGICDDSHYYMIRFEKSFDLLRFSEKVKVLKGGSGLAKAKEYYPYQNKAVSLPLSFKIVGQQQNQLQKRKYVIRMEDFDHKIFQHLFIQTCQLTNLFKHLQKALKIDFTQYQFDLFDNLKANQYQLLQMKWIEIENKLNGVIRNEKLRLHPQLFFHKLKVYQGIWQILTSKEACTCQECHLAIQNISLKSLVQIVEMNDNVDKNSSIKPCPNFVAKINIDLEEKINSSNFSKLSVSKKLSMAFFAQNGSNSKLHYCFKKLAKPKSIQIKIPNLNIKGSKGFIIIQQIYEQETIQILRNRIADSLKLGFCQDFCIYRKIKNQIQFYDESQYLKDLANIEIYPNLYFGKKYYFEKDIEVALIEEKSQTQLFFHPRMQFVVSEIIESVKKYEKSLSQNIMLEFVGLEAQLMAKKLNRKLQDSNSLKIKDQLKLSIVAIKTQALDQIISASVVKERNISQIYRQLIKTYQESQLSNKTFKGEHIKTSVFVNQIYSKDRVYLTVNFNSISIRIPQLNIFKILSHASYRIQSEGSYLIICQRNSGNSEQYHLKCPVSFTALKQIKTYQRVHQMFRCRDSYKDEPASPTK